jgi:hypothetical protein
MYRLIFYFIFVYLIYKGILFIVKLFTAINKKKSSDPISPKSNFKDVEEANFTEIKDDKDKDSH